MTKRNADIRQAAKRAGVYLWQIAEALELQDTNFSRLLRKELDAATKAKIYSIISGLNEHPSKEKAS